MILWKETFIKLSSNEKELKQGYEKYVNELRLDVGYLEAAVIFLQSSRKNQKDNYEKCFQNGSDSFVSNLVRADRVLIDTRGNNLENYFSRK